MTRVSPPPNTPYLNSSGSVWADLLMTQWRKYEDFESAQYPGNYSFSGFGVWRRYRRRRGGPSRRQDYQNCHANPALRRPGGQWRGYEECRVAGCGATERPAEGHGLYGSACAV